MPDPPRRRGWLHDAADRIYADLDGADPLTLTVTARAPDGQLFMLTATARARRVYRTVINPEDYRDSRDDPAR